MAPLQVKYNCKMIATSNILNNIKVMIMAAGEGTRLRPLTYMVPKPLNPILNKPLMAYTLESLSRQGVREVMVNISYLPDMIKDYFGTGEKFGLTIHYSFEKEVLGTAGGVKKVQDFFNDTFLILSGDGLSAIDLKETVMYHKEKRALGTMVLSNKDMRYEYGVILTGKNGRIKKFVEKPKWSDVFSSAVNTGVYVFEPEIFKHIPKDTFYDFGCQVWPELLKNKEKIYAIHTSRYWCDIGDLTVYLQAHKDALDGNIQLSIAGTEVQKKIWVGENTFIGKNVKFMPPCVIGSHCRIEDGCRIGPHASIGDNCRIGPHATVQDSVLWKNVTIGTHTVIVDSILTDNVLLPESRLNFKNAIITSGTKGG